MPQRDRQSYLCVIELEKFSKQLRPVGDSFLQASFEPPQTYSVTSG